MTCEQFRAAVSYVAIETTTRDERQAMYRHAEDCPYCQEWFAAVPPLDDDDPMARTIEALADADSDAQRGGK